MNYRAFEWHTGHFNNAARFRLIIFDRFSHLGAHSDQNAERRRSGIVQPNVAHEQMTALNSAVDRSRAHAVMFGNLPFAPPLAHEAVHSASS